MPAFRTSDEPIVVSPFDVLARGSGTLLIHAMLCNEVSQRCDVTQETALKTTHMGPPLGSKRSNCDAVGSAELSDDEQIKIKKYVDFHRRESESEKIRLRRLGLEWDSSAQYRIHPSASQPTPGCPLWRFSCVGYVIEAYRWARINLLSDPLPLKKIDDLKRLYPFVANRLEDADTRTKLGIGEGDSWPVALVGYVLHSLARPVAEIRGPGGQPYVANDGDEYFPRQ